MQQLNINVTNRNKIKDSKKRLKEELLENPIVIKKIKELNCSEEEFDNYLGYFLAYLEDKTCCDKCKNSKKCPKQFDGIALDLYKSEYGIERKFSLCKDRELERTIALKYKIRDFSSNFLSITLDDIERRKGRFSYEKELLKIDVNDENEGIFIHGPSSSGKSYPLIALCNEYAREGKLCSFVEVRNFFEMLKNSLNNNDEYLAIMSKVKDVDVLVFDNLGDEKISEWSRDDILCSILDYRIKNNYITYITSSYSLDELLDLYNVGKASGEVNKIKTKKFIDKIRVSCPKQIQID